MNVFTGEKILKIPSKIVSFKTAVSLETFVQKPRATIQKSWAVKAVYNSTTETKTTTI